MTKKKTENVQQPQESKEEIVSGALDQDDPKKADNEPDKTREQPMTFKSNPSKETKSDWKPIAEDHFEGRLVATEALQLGVGGNKSGVIVKTSTIIQSAGLFVESQVFVPGASIIFNDGKYRIKGA